MSIREGRRASTPMPPPARTPGGRIHALPALWLRQSRRSEVLRRVRHAPNSSVPQVRVCQSAPVQVLWRLRHTHRTRGSDRRPAHGGRRSGRHSGRSNGVPSSPREDVALFGGSGLATGASWVCYVPAWQAGGLSKVAPLDTWSLWLGAVFAVMLLHERPTMQEGVGLLLVGAGVLIRGLKRCASARPAGHHRPEAPAPAGAH